MKLWLWLFYLTIEENNLLDLGLMIEENGVVLLALGLMIEEKWRNDLAVGFESPPDPESDPPLLGSVDLLLQKVPLLGPASSMPSYSAKESSGFVASKWDLFRRLECREIRSLYELIRFKASVLVSGPKAFENII